jgi:hypothetical protein
MRRVDLQSQNFLESQSAVIDHADLAESHERETGQRATPYNFIQGEYTEVGFFGHIEAIHHRSRQMDACESLTEHFRPPEVMQSDDTHQ